MFFSTTSIMQKDNEYNKGMPEASTFLDTDIAFASEFPEVIALGKIKSIPEDFIVTEITGFDFTGEGQHLCVLVEKKNLNTLDVIKILADFFQVPRKCVGYLGLKDKHAITRQWFSIDLASSAFDERHLEVFDDFFASTVIAREKFNNVGNGSVPEVHILECKRNRKKLQIGRFFGNRFEIIIRDIVDPQSGVWNEDVQNKIESRLQLLNQFGFVNYFGEQRFGNNFQNIHELKSFESLNLSRNRSLRSRVLSTYRACAFNHYLSERINLGLQRTVLNGDVLQFADGRSLFQCEDNAEALQQRVNNGELVLTGPLSGFNEGMARDESLKLEENILESFSIFQSLVIRFKLEMSRRALIVFPKNLSWKFLDNTSLFLQFELPTGSYATSFLGELVNSKSSELKDIKMYE